MDPTLRSPKSEPMIQMSKVYILMQEQLSHECDNVITESKSESVKGLYWSREEAELAMKDNIVKESGADMWEEHKKTAADDLDRLISQDDKGKKYKFWITEQTIKSPITYTTPMITPWEITSNDIPAQKMQSIYQVFSGHRKYNPKLENIEDVKLEGTYWSYDDAKKVL